MHTSAHRTFSGNRSLMAFVLATSIFPLGELVFERPRRTVVDLWRRLLSGIMAMAGFVPNEGETLMGGQVLKNIVTDRGTNLDLLLFTNVAPGETITAAALTEPTGTGYARITLTDATWTEGGAGVYSYAEQTFTGGAGGWTGNIQGYAIVSKGTTPRIVAIEVDSVNAPFTMAADDTYKVTPTITFKDSLDA